MLLISNSRLGSSDAISVQLRRLLSSPLEPIYHFYWTKLPRVVDEPEIAKQRWLPHNFPFQLPYGRRFGAHFWKKCALPFALKSSIEKLAGKTGSALVLVDNQEQAQHAQQILDSCRVENYIVHLMDLLLSPSDTLSTQSPLGRLISEATIVQVVSERLAQRITHLRKDIQVAALAADPLLFEPQILSSVLESKPILVSSGNFYNAAPRKLRFLREIFIPTWIQFKRDFLPNATWLHCGSRPPSDILPDEAANQIRFTGFLSSKDYCNALRTSRCALLPLEHFADEGWRYSIPSRLIDYLAAGVPTILPPCDGTATADFSDSHSSVGFSRVSNNEACLNALCENFLNDDVIVSKRMAAHQAAAKNHPESVCDSFGKTWKSMCSRK